MKELLYLYCVTKDKPSSCDFKDLGIKVRPVFFSGTYALVSSVSPDDFSEDNLKKHLADMGWVEKNIRLHEKVIEEIMKDRSVLPFKFGTVFESEANVEKLLKENNTGFRAVLALLDGKEEWGLKIYCNNAYFMDALCAENERIAEIDKEIIAAGKGKAYFLKKKKDEIIKDIINEKISEYTRDCLERLKVTAADTMINRILPKEVTEKDEDMVLNAAFLINNKRIKEFENVLTHIKTKYADNRLIFDCTGPWPPYNFCTPLKSNRF
ncbi:MAG: GvpL/GvpF family gas vesicle protein [bacterium]